MNAFVIHGVSSLVSATVSYCGFSIAKIPPASGLIAAINPILMLVTPIFARLSGLAVNKHICSEESLMAIVSGCLMAYDAEQALELGTVLFIMSGCMGMTVRICKQAEKIKA